MAIIAMENNTQTKDEFEQELQVNLITDAFKECAHAIVQHFHAGQEEEGLLDTGIRIRANNGFLYRIDVAVRVAEEEATTEAVSPS
jgi:hypothetical protein